MTDTAKKSYLDIAKILSVMIGTATICFYLADIKTAIVHVNDKYDNHEYRINQHETSLSEIRHRLWNEPFKQKYTQNSNH